MILDNNKKKLAIHINNLLKELDKNSIIHLPNHTDKKFEPHRVGWLRKKVNEVIISEYYNEKQKHTLNSLRNALLVSLVKIYKIK